MVGIVETTDKDVSLAAPLVLTFGCNWDNSCCMEEDPDRGICLDMNEIEAIMMMKIIYDMIKPTKRYLSFIFMYEIQNKKKMVGMRINKKVPYWF